jgi:predicted  nucleic acid-binding Zn-ribbon protein
MKDDRGNLDLTKQIDALKKRVQQAELELSLVKAVGMNSPEMRALQMQKEFLQEKCRQAGAEINELKRDNKKLAQEVGDYIERIIRSSHA